MRLDIFGIQKVHFIGVGGIGVSALVRLFAARGVQISGSDIALPPQGFLPHGSYHEGESADHVPSDAGLIIYSPAVPFSNAERMRARELGIPELSYPEALASVTSGSDTIAVSGTHGKSTTTALLGKLCEAGGLDPTVIVGADVPGWDHNLRRASGTSLRKPLFVVEACEYRRHMLNLSPQTILLTNLELDHPDYYRDLADIKSAFCEYIDKLHGEGLLVVNNDDPNLRDILSGYDGALVTFGVGANADLVAKNITDTGNGRSFELLWKGDPLGTFSTPLAGLYNIYNIIAATAAFLAYGGSSEAIAGVLADFHGIGRRFETVGTIHGIPVISDYAHHPTALAAVSEAAFARFRGQKVLIVFRPHHRERTAKLFDQFVETILGIPSLVLLEIYDVPGRENALSVSSRDLRERALSRNPALEIDFAENIDAAERVVRDKAHRFNAILIVGAGDADLLARRLVDSPVIAEVPSAVTSTTVSSLHAS